MPCMYSIPAWIGTDRKATVKAGEGYTDLSGFYLPCGHCSDCLKNRSRSNVVRLNHQFQEVGGVGCMVTLTYDNIHLPVNGSLCYRDVQLFFKKLRKRLGDEGKKLKYFVACEYGKRMDRPHYHILFFGWEPSDTLYKASYTIGLCWDKGSHQVDVLNLGTISYAAQYLMKKKFGAGAKEHYGLLEPERCVWSKGIGESWWIKNYQDLLIDDSAVIDGKKVRVPAYYDKKLKQYYPEKFEEVKRERVIRAIVSYKKSGQDPSYREDVSRRRWFHRNNFAQGKERGSL